jgi:hypothetical protein
MIRCWCCGVVYPNPHKDWCLDVEKIVRETDKKLKKIRKPPRVKRKVKVKASSKRCALCRVEVKEGAFCSELCRSDAWRLFARKEENVRYSGSNRTRIFR